jgi:hypothetical protein
MLEKYIENYEYFEDIPRGGGVKYSRNLVFIQYIFVILYLSFP